MKKAFIHFCFILLASGAITQTPEEIHFDQLDKWFDAKEDTLYVINFWATWCKPCVAEMPYFEAANEHFTDQKVKIIFVSLDFKSDLETRLVPFLEKKQLKSDVYLMVEPKMHLWIDRVSPDWSGAIPATIFVNKKRDIRDFHEGELDHDELFQLIEKLNSSK